jgi:ParB family chromosome partitioning protein
MKLSTALVAVKKINSAVPRSNFSESELERAAQLILKAEGIINPLVIRRTSLESYEVVGGDFEYHVAARAREIDPRKGEMIGAFIIEPENEEVLLEQIKALRMRASDSREQAAAAKAEMEQLAGFLSPDQKTDSEQQKPVAEQRVQPEETAIDESLLDKKLQPLTALLNQLLSQSSRSVEKTSEDRISSIESKIEGISSAVEKLAGLVEKLIPAPPPPKPPKLNLREAPRAEIERALKEIGAIPNQIKASCQAIEYWKKPGKKLSWENLEKSIKTGPDKIQGFAKGTYQKLQQIGEILD